MVTIGNNSQTKVTINYVTYESSTQLAQVECTVHNQNTFFQITYLIDHTELNRIIAKLIAAGFDDIYSLSTKVQLEDGNEIIDFDFSQNITNPVLLDGFEFSRNSWQIRA